MKVLVSAFSCGPGRGSEPGIGWNWVEQISREHEVWLLTSDEFEADIRRQLTPGIHASFIGSFRRWNRLRNFAVPGLDWLYYYWWQWKACRIATRLHTAVTFDIAHHVTFGSWRAPSFISLLPVPFVFGPVGGGETIPRPFWRELGRRGRLYEAVRAAGQVVCYLDPLVRLTMARAAVILLANHDTLGCVPPSSRSKTRIMACAGVLDRRSFRPSVTEGAPARGFEVVFAGVLEPRKGGALALRGFERFARGVPEARLSIIGDGSELQHLTRLARELNIDGRVRFRGWVQHAQVMEAIDSAEVFLLPSLRDTGGCAVLEAMLAEKPVVCVDLSGPGEYVTPACGMKIPAGDPEQTVQDIALALNRLAADPALRSKLGQAGRRRVLDQFEWNRKGEALMRIYEQLVPRAALATPATLEPSE